MNTKWTKLRKETFGTLELHLSNGVIKHFCSKYRSWAMRKAKVWYLKDLIAKFLEKKGGK